MDIEDIISFLKSASLLKYSPYNRRNRNRSTRFAMNPSQAKYIQQLGTQ